MILKFHKQRTVVLLAGLMVLVLTACGRVETRQEYYPDGGLMAEEIGRGSRMTTKAYLPDGTLISEKKYVHGKLHGVSRIFNNEGKLFQEIRYRDGKEVDRKEF